MKKNIIVITEIIDNEIQPVTYELISCAEILAAHYGAEINILVINPEPEQFADTLKKLAADKIYAVKTTFKEPYNCSAFKNIIHETVQKLQPVCICIANTARGNDFAPGLAIKLGAACITAVNALSFSGEDCIFSRSVFGGRLNTGIKSETDTTVLTIQPGAFKKSNPGKSIADVIYKESSILPDAVSSTGTILPDPVKSDLGDAGTIVAIGRGIQEAENIPLAEKFSSLFPDSAIACSRPIVDQGWMPYKCQVGITGSVVTPDVYIGCGISGSSQHIAGMKNAGFVIGINHDPNAVFFNFSDICIVEDLLTFFEAFEKIIKPNT